MPRVILHVNQARIFHLWTRFRKENKKEKGEGKGKWENGIWVPILWIKEKKSQVAFHVDDENEERMDEMERSRWWWDEKRVWKESNFSIFTLDSDYSWEWVSE